MTTVQDIPKQWDEILEQETKLQHEVLEKRSQIVKWQVQSIEKILMDYITRCQDQDINITDARIKGTAIAILQEINELYDHDLDANDISFSNRWFDNFKKANNLKQYVSHGENGDVDLSKLEGVPNAIRQQLATFDVENIYNCDETGLHLRAMSNKTISTGPIRRRNINIDECKIAMIIDIAGYYNDGQSIGRTNSIIIRLPSNSTSIMQPLDAGIIQPFKVNYSQQMLQLPQDERL